MLAVIGLFLRIVMIARHVSRPIIALLRVLGVFGVVSSPTDRQVMPRFGFLGYGMRKLGFPFAPVMIGFVLEPNGEQSVRQALAMSSGDWSLFVSTPISSLFLALTAPAAAFIARTSWKDCKEVRA